MSLKVRLFKNTIYNIGGYVYLLLASFISVPIILNKLGSEYFGLYVLFSSLVPLSSSIDLGLSQAIIRWLSLPGQSQKQRLETWQSGLFMYLVTGIIVTAVFSVLIFFIFIKVPAVRQIPSLSILIISILTIITILVNHLTSLLLTIPQSDHRFDIYNLRTMLSGTGATLISALVVTFSPKIESLLFYQLVFDVITGLSLITYMTNRFGRDGLIPKYKKEVSSKLIGFGVKNFAGNVANQVNYQTSKYILGAFLTGTAIAIFSIPQTLVMKAAGGISQLTLAFFPLSTSISNKERIDKLKKLVYGMEVIVFLLGILALVVTYAFGQDFLIFWLKNKEIATEAYPILQIMAWFLLLNILTPIPAVLMDSLNYPQLPSISAMLTTFLNLLLIVVLTPIYKSIGAAYAALISSIVMVPVFLIMASIALNRYTRRVKLQ